MYKNILLAIDLNDDDHPRVHIDRRQSQQLGIFDDPDRIFFRHIVVQIFG